MGNEMLSDEQIKHIKTVHISRHVPSVLAIHFATLDGWSHQAISPKNLDRYERYALIAEAYIDHYKKQMKELESERDALRACVDGLYGALFYAKQMYQNWKDGQ